MYSMDLNSMKKLTIHIICVALAIISFGIGAKSASAGVSDNVTGYAWNDTIGWISFNCTNDNSCFDPATGMGVDYGVNIDPTNGTFKGYAWNDQVGWISFNDSDLAGCTSIVSVCATPNVKLSTTTPPSGNSFGGVYGHFKILSLGDDGIVSFSTEVAGANYHTSPDFTGNGGVTYDNTSKKLIGWAWSSALGWIKFNPSMGNGVEVTGISFGVQPNGLPPALGLGNVVYSNTTSTSIYVNTNKLTSCTATSTPTLPDWDNHVFQISSVGALDEFVAINIPPLAPTVGTGTLNISCTTTLGTTLTASDSFTFRDKINYVNFSANPSFTNSGSISKIHYDLSWWGQYQPSCRIRANVHNDPTNGNDGTTGWTEPYTIPFPATALLNKGLNNFSGDLNVTMGVNNTDFVITCQSYDAGSLLTTNAKTTVFLEDVYIPKSPFVELDSNKTTATENEGVILTYSTNNVSSCTTRTTSAMSGDTSYSGWTGRTIRLNDANVMTDPSGGAQYDGGADVFIGKGNTLFTLDCVGLDGTSRIDSVLVRIQATPATVVSPTIPPCIGNGDTTTPDVATLTLSASPNASDINECHDTLHPSISWTGAEIAGSVSKTYPVPRVPGTMTFGPIACTSISGASIPNTAQFVVNYRESGSQVCPFNGPGTRGGLKFQER